MLESFFHLVSAMNETSSSAGEALYSLVQVFRDTSKKGGFLLGRKGGPIE